MERMHTADPGGEAKNTAPNPVANPAERPWPAAASVPSSVLQDMERMKFAEPVPQPGANNALASSLCGANLYRPPVLGTNTGQVQSHVLEDMERMQAAEPGGETRNTAPNPVAKPAERPWPAAASVPSSVLQDMERMKFAEPVPQPGANNALASSLCGANLYRPPKLGSSTAGVTARLYHDLERMRIAEPKTNRPGPRLVRRAKCPARPPSSGLYHDMVRMQVAEPAAGPNPVLASSLSGAKSYMSPKFASTATHPSQVPRSVLKDMERMQVADTTVSTTVSRSPQPERRSQPTAASLPNTGSKTNDEKGYADMVKMKIARPTRPWQTANVLPPWVGKMRVEAADPQSPAVVLGSLLDAKVRADTDEKAPSY
eukprot:TRINITY_DN3990_c0_g1_i2.p1 TRINITY_DN3990_c0_g1~~TRINITY_DN3990_c0_g1_i2.p1  ORF type:complete len:372 (+),score=50.75 TRINITY_DN3990_c0_g1_i2:260-1375(+)